MNELKRASEESSPKSEPVLRECRYAHALYYVPTHKRCDSGMDAWLAEAADASRLVSKLTFAVIESNSGVDAHVNREALGRLSSKIAVQSIHFSVDDQHAFIGDIAHTASLHAADSAHLRELLRPEAPNYSAGPNMASLLAAALGAEVVIRRDSDTRPVRVGEDGCFPAEIEISCLGRSVEDIGLGANIADADSQVFCVGTDYAGRPAFERDVFVELGRRFLFRHEHIEHPHLSSDDLKARLDRKAAEHSEGDTSGPLRIMLDRTGRSEMGCVGLAGSYRLLPEMPIDRMLGSDYFQKGLLYRLQLPQVYHTARVAHPPRRGKPDSFSVEYAIRDFRFKLLRPIWRELNCRLDAEFAARPEKGLSAFDASIFTSSFQAALSSVAPTRLVEIVDKTVTLLEDAASVATGRTSGDLRKASAVIRQTSQANIDDVVDAIHNHCWLAERWGSLIRAAENCRADAYIYPY